MTGPPRQRIVWGVLKLSATFKDSSFTFEGDSTVDDLSKLFSTYVSAQGSAEAEAAELNAQIDKLNESQDKLAAAVAASTPPAS